MKLTHSAIILICVAMLGTSCASRKGSSSLDSSTSQTTTTGGTPKIRSDEQSKAAAERAKQEAFAAAQEAERLAQQQAEAAKRQAEAAAEQARKAAEEAKQKAQQQAAEAERKAREAAEEAKRQAEQKAAEAEAARQKALAEKVTVREEAVKVIEKKDASNNGRYHIIIGSFKMLDNARTLCNDAVKQGFLPSIMENDEGMYRVAIFTGDLEETARKKIAEIRTQYPQYVGIWLLVEKR